MMNSKITRPQYHNIFGTISDQIFARVIIETIHMATIIKRFKINYYNIFDRKLCIKNTFPIEHKRIYN